MDFEAKAFRIAGRARGATPADAIAWCLRRPEARAEMEAVARSVRRERFLAEWPHALDDLARRALAAFFRSGEQADAEEAVERVAGWAFASSRTLAREAGSEGAFSHVAAAVARSVAAAFPAVPGEEGSESYLVDLAADAAAAISERAEEAFDRADAHRALDAVRGQPVIVCYMPGRADGASLEDALTSHWGEHSDVTTIVPDANLGSLLRLANVSSAELAEAALEEVGVDLAAEPGPGAEPWERWRAESWRAFDVRADESRPALVDAARLVEGIDSAPFGSHAMIAFRAPAGALLARDWSAPLEVRGGLLGLHNFANGSGHPLRFEGSAVVDARPGDFMVGEGRRFDFDEAYGFTAAAFGSSVSDAEAAPAPSPAP